MNIDEDLPRPKKSLFTPPVLDTLSVEEERGYIAQLKDEIARVEADIAKKQAWKSAAEDIFKK